MISFKEAFGKNLKDVRKSKGITQESLAEMVGIHPRQVSKIETGEHFPNSTTLENICIALSISPKELFNFELKEFTQETGTGSRYTYKAVIEGNVIYIDNNNFRKQKIEKINSKTDVDIKMINLAKKTGQPITVEYFNNNQNYKTIEYYPNGTYKILKDNKKEETEILLKQIENLIKIKGKENYFKLAVKALENNQDLEKLEFLLSGIKMEREK